MILESLNELYDRLSDDSRYGVAPPGYSMQKVTFVVVLKPDGDLFAIQDARREIDGRLRPRQVRVLGSTKSPGSGTNPCFLWDNVGYMLGFKPEDENSSRTARTFEAFRKRHLDAEDSIDSRAFTAVCRFLESWEPGRAEEYPALTEAAETGFGVFKIQGQEAFVHDDPEVDDWWRQQSDAEDAVTGQCLVTGRRATLARTHGKIRGVAGAQGAGGSLVGFNEPAYGSYGKSQSYNAPVAEDVAFRYVTAVNALLDGPMRDTHRIVLGDTTVAFWTERPSVAEDIFLAFTSRGSAIKKSDDVEDAGQRQKIEFFLRAIREGRPAYGAIGPDIDGTPFYLLGLSPNAGRVSVRFFWRESLGTLLDQVHRHHQDIGLVASPPVGKWRGDPEFPGVRALLSQSAREAKDIPPNLSGPLLQAIVTGAPYPVALVAAVLRRIRADRDINYLRCCIIKGYLTRNLKEEVSMALDPQKADPAYRLGRLFATLEKTQKDALGEKLNKTIRDSFYGSASATPGVVFPRLLRTYQHHLGKLTGGMRVNRERLVQEILAPMDDFPAHLSLKGQGLFALGYYHQTRDLYTKRDKVTSTDEKEIQQ